MMRSNIDENLFSLYLMGMKIAVINFSETGIYHSKLNLSTGLFMDFEKLKDDDIYDVPLKKIQNLYIDYIYADKTQRKFTLNNGDHYEKHTKFSTTIESKKIVSQVWIQRNTTNPLDIIYSDKKLIGFYYNARGGARILVKNGYESLTPLTYWQAEDLSQIQYNIDNIGTSMIPMRDDVALATEIWCPKNKQSPSPTILVRTPYGRRGSSKYIGFVQRGYNVVLQDVRGKEDSEGEFAYHTSEKNDGDDTLTWIANQPWSNGDIGMIGASYLGYVQWAAASSGNPHLKAIVSIVTSGSPFGDIPRPGGTILSGTLAWSFAMRSKVCDFTEAERDDWDDILSIRPLTNITNKVFGRKIDFWDNALKHPNNDDYWMSQDWTLHGDKINIPALLVSGWYDDDGRGTSEAWNMNMKNNRINQKLILGPWLHGLNTTREINNIDYGKYAIDYKLEINYLKWFDRFLKNKDNGIDQEDKVSFFLVNDSKWYTSDNWPPNNITPTNMYIDSNGDANTSNGDGLIDRALPSGKTFDSYNFNPENSAPFLIDISQNELSVPQNYKWVELRDDVLVYTSKPLAKDLVIAGDIQAIIYASSNAQDTDWVVRLTDVDPMGNSIRLSDGVIRARYRYNYSNPTLLEPHKIEQYTIKMTKIANKFKAGHRIRVEITSGMKNFAFPNHNTGNNPATDTEYMIARQKIYHSNDYPSHIVLPILYD